MRRILCIVFVCVLGIGTAAPGYPLEVDGQVFVDGDIAIESNYSISKNFSTLDRVYFGNTYTALFSNADLKIGFDTNNNGTGALRVVKYGGYRGERELLTMINNGNVGLGTTAPRSRLEIKGDPDVRFSLAVGNIAVAGDNRRFFTIRNNPNRAETIFLFSPALAGDGGPGTDTIFRITNPWRIDSTVNFGSPFGLNGSDFSFVHFDPGAGELHVRNRVGVGTFNPIFDLDVRGDIGCDTLTESGSDYAEWIEKDRQEDLEPGDILGLNPQTLNVRRYRKGDEFVGVYSTSPGTVGNQDRGKTQAQMRQTHALVGLFGQLPFKQDQVRIRNNIVLTPDGKRIGLLLSNGWVLLGR